MRGLNERVSPGQVAVLLFVVVWPRYLLLLPSLVAEMAEQDAWLSNLLGGCGGLAVVLALLRVAALAPGRDLVEAAGDGLGRAGGRVLGLLLLAVLLFMTYTTLRSSGAFIKEIFLRVTPMWATAALLASQGLAGALWGLEAVARVAGLVVALLFAVLVPSAALLLGQFDPRLLFPVLAAGFRPVLRGAPVSAFAFGGAVVLGMLLPAVAGRPRAGAWLAGLGVTWVVAGGLLAVDQGLMGWYNLSRLPFSFLEGLRLVRIPPFLERVEVAVAAVWLLVTFVEIALLFDVQARCAARVLGLGSHRLLVPVLALAVAVASLNLPARRTVFGRVLLWGSVVLAPVQVLLPLVVVLALLWRRGRRLPGAGSPAPSQGRRGGAR